MADAAEDFWRFSLALYAAPGVAPACLALQDEQGRDVNLLLYCGWVGASGRGRLDQAAIAAADARLAPWRQGVVEPLRAARRALKDVTGAEALYAAVKAVELDAERQAQRLLAALAPAAAGRSRTERQADGAANLLAYAGAAAAPLVAALAAAVEG